MKLHKMHVCRLPTPRKLRYVIPCHHHRHSFSYRFWIDNVNTLFATPSHVQQIRCARSTFPYMTASRAPSGTHQSRMANTHPLDNGW